MNIKQLLYLGLLFPAILAFADDCNSCCPNDCYALNTWQPRAFSSYSLTNILFMKDVDVYEEENENHHYFGSSNEYMHSFEHGCTSLGALPFWSGTNTMTIGTNNGESDVDAYQFGMGEALTQGSITLKPVVQHFGSDLMYYYQQCKKEGVSFVAKVYLPVGGMKIDSRLCENPAELSNADDTEWLEYPAGTNRYQTLTAAFNGGAVSEGGKTASGSTTSVNKPIALNNGRIAPCALTHVGVGDLAFFLGANVVNSEDGFFMLGAKLSMPTCPAPTGRYIFEPIFGHAGHFGLGIEFSGAYKGFFANDWNVECFVQGEALHLFQGRQPSWRTFDLAQNGCGSKYLLVQFYFPGNADTTANPSNPTGRVPSFITQAANITTFPVLSNFDVEGSFATMINANCGGNWSFGIGLEAWGRTRENLSIDCCNILNYDRVSLNDYAVLGRQISVNNDNSEVLTLCEPLAKINKSQDRVTSTAQDYDTDLIKDARDAANRIPADLSDALDICGAAQPASVSGKVMFQTSYNWKESKHNPNLTLFGAVEFSNKVMANLWSVGLKGSVNF